MCVCRISIKITYLLTYFYVSYRLWWIKFIITVIFSSEIFNLSRQADCERSTHLAVRSAVLTLRDPSLLTINNRAVSQASSEFYIGPDK